MSCTFGRAGDDGRYVHDLARDLAAARVDGPLAPEDQAWLAEHLESCGACAAVAAEYDAQHDLFAELRPWSPEPPRDLWARTSAAIEAEGGRRASGRRWPRAAGRMISHRRSRLAPAVAVVAVLALVGSGLLNAIPLGPDAGSAAPTPIALTAAADVQVIVRDSNGNLQILSRPVDSVCPSGVTVCGAQPTFNITPVSGVASATTLQGAISPTGDRMVVVARDAGGEGVYIVPVRPAATPTPGKSATPVPSQTAAPASSPPIATSSSESASPAVQSSAAATPPVESATPASGSPAASPATSSSATATPPADSQGPSASPAASGDASPAASTAPSTEPSPQPTVEVTPMPNAAIRIASGVTVVGVPIYAPDGVHLAFAAMPSDGTAGPDIYVWAAGDQTAQAVTSDHSSWLAAWTADGILVSRVADGVPATFLLDPAGGHATAVGDPGIWLPTLSPDGRAAAWWSGTMQLAADGVTWVPDNGRLVLGSWPAGPGAPTPQLLARGPLGGWQVQWADDGSAVAVWTENGAKGTGGRLSLYRVDPTTKVADLTSPMLDATPANPDFSLRSGRLAWTTPTQGVPPVVEVLAWSGRTTGRLEVAAGGSGTVVP